ncbi:MAG: deoxyribose-phosphate aldolase [Bacteroidetes bacterium SW_9_63_38]|nr:MAG: deoxyribose-phosphate aldolase [Bacteroidetes bacterium SW_9_63_38]
MSVHDWDRLIDALREHRSATDAAPYIEEALQALESPARPGSAGPAEVPTPAPEELAAYIDHTQLRPTATDAQIDRLCEEARTYGFSAACVSPPHVSRTARSLEGTDVTPCTVVGFPHGANQPAIKAQEAERAVMAGARELDMVLALGALASGRYSDAEADVRAVVTAARETGEAVGTHVLVKVILETALLDLPQTAIACVIAKRAGADFVKTSTGFASTGARAEDVALMRQIVGPEFGVKASGGVGSAADATRMLAHGAIRIGASGSVAIIEEARAGR